ncbi:MAG: glycine--tRNA ligase subunit beta [Gammaproteobacteria bacterium]|nr:glycine--tRNA ligase subunit beta [Gammaproteobacteria bacterium]NND38273.1 glycine--tRNA ligase subunit beta [Pseudomonadales bacterium]NNL11058.1 glycine--tRNA ligase subunit beta [Pseudomonadales bacterium]RZV58191.1 MAG: glycine--tRNA ligase subunit beta [Pseudomonadales bacterium]
MSKHLHSATAPFLVELGTEELPPTALSKLSAAFAAELQTGLAQARLAVEAKQVECFASPRRLAVRIRALPTLQPEQQIEKLGPAVAAAFDKEGQPSKAALGFARSNGVEFEQLQRAETDKGERLCFRSTEAGQPAADLMPGIVARALAALPIPKRMRWGASRVEFVRPVHWLIMLLGEDIVDGEVLGLRAGRSSYGHRFHAPQAIQIQSAISYEQQLGDAHVVASFDARREMIVQQVQACAESLGGSAVIEKDLLDEVTALVEKPVALAGAFDAAFLRVPHEALVYSMSEHQKYFHLRDSSGALMPNFVAVSNIESKDASKVIIGNERVIRPRLADAAFFFDTDCKHSLATLRERLRPIVFQQKLGTVFEKTERIAALAKSIAATIGADASQAQQAGQLCKADLASDMVLEFDKMQGIAGGYYARHEGLHNNVALAIEQHYFPRHAGDQVPTSGEACAVAMADRLDTLTGIFGIGQLPSGSKDPFALRRASIGLLQIILQNNLVVDLAELALAAAKQHAVIDDARATAQQVGDYVFDRFAAHYQEQGLATEVFQAVRCVAGYNALDFDARVQAVASFTARDESQSLAAANKRVGNILEKAGTVDANSFDLALLAEPAEQALCTALDAAATQCQPLFEAGDYREGLLALTSLREPVDAFFDNVMVNADDPKLRDNRLALLARLRALFLSVADISVLAVAKA